MHHLTFVWRKARATLTSKWTLLWDNPSQTYKINISTSKIVLYSNGLYDQTEMDSILIMTYAVSKDEKLKCERCFYFLF